MEEFRVCANCGYERGFHIYFKKIKKKIKISLICPNCGQSFDINWLESSIKSLKTETGPIY
jgi:transcription elongation factor Elf1